MAVTQKHKKFLSIKGILCLFSIGCVACEKKNKPNIILILADDLGWNDVSFHGSSQIPTPNIDALAYNGVILNNYYTAPICTPSRAALMTGKYPIHMGMQHSYLKGDEARGLPLNEKLMPEYLKEAGYATHMIGKWHLGFYQSKYAPIFRGFDSHFGYWNGHQDYYKHTHANPRGHENGFDMRRNMSVAFDTIGHYTTDLFTEEAIHLIGSHDKETPLFLYLSHLAVHSPLQAPQEEIDKFSYIKTSRRRTYAAMVSKLDQSVGKVIAALSQNEMLENSIILFISDNGAPSDIPAGNSGSNFPLRGIKGSAWDAASRAVAAIWSPFINKTQRVSNELIHVTDWLPTFLSAAGFDTNELSAIDGLNIWPAIAKNERNPRTELLINIDEIAGFEALRHGDFKYVNGSAQNGDEWYGKLEEGADKLSYDTQQVLTSEAGRTIAQNDGRKALTTEDINRLRAEATIRCNIEEEQKVACKPLESPCLFNIKEDPCEMVNIAASNPGLTRLLEESMNNYRNTLIAAKNLPGDERSDPIHYNNIWVNWGDPNPSIL